MRLAIASPLALIAAICVAPTSAAIAQEPPPRKVATPEETQKTMESALNSMVPMMQKVTESTIDLQLKIAERPETAARVATFKHNLYVELQQQGFTPAQALQITAGTAAPTVSGR